MTKRKPDKVIEYRISLQDKEREILESAIGAYQVNRIMTPIVTLMNDVTGMIVLLTLAASLGFTGIAFACIPGDPTNGGHPRNTDRFLSSTGSSGPGSRRDHRSSRADMGIRRHLGACLWYQPS